MLKDTGDEVEQLTAAPRTGIWRMDEGGGGISFARSGNDWHSLHDESEAFFLRVLAPGDYRYPGADLGVLVARSRMQTEDNRLTERARQWIDGIHAQFAGTPRAPADGSPAGRRARLQDLLTAGAGVAGGGGGGRGGGGREGGGRGIRGAARLRLGAALLLEDLECSARSGRTTGAR